MWVLGSNIAIGLYVLDIWSVLCSVCGLWDLNSDRTVLTGHMVSAVCSICGSWDLRYRLYCMYWTCDVVCPISRWYDLI